MYKKLKSAAHAMLGPYRWSRTSFAQEGEDLVIDRLLEGKRNGFYVDVGCHHPVRFSNSYFFYRRGWSGICIDPLPGTRERFRRWRSRDVVLEYGVSNRHAELIYHMFDEPALNTFDEQLANDRSRNTRYKIVRSISVPTDTLASLLHSRFRPGQRIDFLTVDVEGLDLEVLQSNDWGAYRPRLVVAECLNFVLAGAATDPTAAYLRTIGYEAYAKTGNSVIFLDSGSSA